MLSRVQRDEFDRLGFVRVPGLVPASDATRMCERLWSELERRHGIRRDEPDTWRMVQPRHLQALRRDGAFDGLGSPALRAIADQLLGHGRWEPPPHWGDPLPAFPCGAARWTLPSDQWHIDWPARGAPEPLFALKILACVGPVVAGGGGTLVLAGSHALVARLAAAVADWAGQSSAVRAVLARRHAWLADLWSREQRGDRIRRFMGDGALLDGIELRIVELTGAPGDVALLHPWLFHAPAPNCTAGPRMVVGHNLNTLEGRARFAPSYRRSA